MGTVFRAFDTVLQRPVALKVVRRQAGEVQGSQSATTRLLREARAAAALSHVNVVSVFDVGETNGEAYISMEFVQGRSLRTCVEDAGASWQVRVRWLAEVARALAEAHRLGLVHRDIKPDNVLIDAAGIAKVVDFGIARAIPRAVQPDDRTETAGFATLTAPGMVVGTPLYMAPEQLHSEPVGPATDQFAWGVLAYELLAGRNPWTTQRGQMDALLSILTRQPEPLERLAPDVPKAICDCVHRALSKAVAERHASMGEVIAILEEHAEHAGRIGSSKAAARHVAPKSPSLSSKGKVALTVCGVGALAILAGVATGPFASKATPSASAASAASPARSAVPFGSAARASSPVPAAEVGYSVSMLAYRDGAYADALQGMKKVTEADPSLAAAWLRIAIWTLWSDPVGCRRAIVETSKFKDKLSVRDQDLAAAMRPILEHTAWDLPAFAQNLTALAGRYPGDAELLGYAALFHSIAGNHAEVIAFVDKALEADPGFTLIRVARGASKLALAQDWRGELESCMRVAPGSTECLNQLTYAELETGDCTGAEKHAKLYTTLAPSDSRGYGLLAMAQVALGRPEEAVRETLKRASRVAHQQDDRLLMGSSGAISLHEELAMRVLAGNFAAAEEAARALLDSTKDAPEETAHAAPYRRLVELLAETGRVGQAADLAEEYLRRREGWTQDALTDDWGIERDVQPTFNALLVRAGKINREEWLDRRTRWIAGIKARTTPHWQKWIWSHGYARPAESAAEAREALAAMAGYSPQPAMRLGTLADADVGRVLVLAGRPGEAIAPLEAATRSCTVLQAPFLHTRAHYFLGLARESQGDKDKACEAYAVVLRRWGKPGSRSVSAALAAERSSALQCPRAL